MTNKIRLSLKIVISVGALIFAFRNTNLIELGQVGINIKWPLLVLAVAASIVSVVFLGLRWKRILAPIDVAPLSLLVRGQYIGLFGNNVFPLRAGEFMRADFARRRLGKGFITILTTIFFERLLDLSMAALVFGILLMTTSMTVLPIGYDLYFLIGSLLIVGIVVIVVQNRDRIVALIRTRFPEAVDNQEWFAELLTYRAMFTYLLLSANRLVTLRVAVPTCIEQHRFTNGFHISGASSGCYCSWLSYPGCSRRDRHLSSGGRFLNAQSVRY